MSKTIIVKVPYIVKRQKKEKEFEITIVPNKFNRDFSAYTVKLNAVKDLVEKIKAEEDKSQVEKYLEKLNAMNLEAVLKSKYDLIKTIMIANDYEFDLDWWDLKIDPTDVEGFIAQCAMKDAEDEAKKKELLRVLGY